MSDSAQSLPPTGRAAMLAAVLLILTFAVFHSILGAGFVNWDDPVHLYQNPWLNPVTPAHLRHFWQTSYEGLYIPLSYMAYASLASVAHLPMPAPDPSGGMTTLNPHVFHAASLLLHLLNVLFVFTLLRLLVRDDRAAFGGALLFGIHPLQTESVAWISELRGLLGASFALTALWQYLLSVRALDTRSRRLHYGLALMAFLLALLSKPSAVVVPLVAFLLDWGILRRPLRQAVIGLAGWLCVAVPVIFWTQQAQPVPASLHIPWWQRFFVAGDALAFYDVKLVLPLRMAAVYDRTPAHLLHTAWGHWTWLLPAGVFVLLWLCRRRGLPLLVAGAIFVAGVLPVLGFVPFVYQEFSTVADRYVYLALLGPALGLAWLLAQAKAKASLMPAVTPICGLALAACASLSMMQASYWHDSEALFTHTLSIAPNSPAMHTDYGETLSAWGQGPAAISQFTEALADDPTDAVAHYDLALALQRQGRTAAISQYREALRCNPDYAQAHCNLAQLLDGSGQTPEAMEHLRRALQIDPDLAPAHNTLALLLAEQGHTDEAIAEWRQTARLWPNFADAHSNLAVALAREGRRADALVEMREAEQLKRQPLSRPQ